MSNGFKVSGYIGFKKTINRVSCSQRNQMAIMRRRRVSKKLSSTRKKHRKKRKGRGVISAFAIPALASLIGEAVNKGTSVDWTTTKRKEFNKAYKKVGSWYVPTGKPSKYSQFQRSLY